ncbi:MAG: endonuclease/exonuclease/phosphatase family protein [Planctomycetes bacterium]|nr:endonuclease/exonuclease/phosphatase family protein [Planctomycetota bacterium]
MAKRVCVVKAVAWMVALCLAAGGTLAQAQTGTFIDRQSSADLRIMSYNVYWDSIFPDVDPTQAAKFERVVHALDADILNIQELNRSATSVANLLDTIAPTPGGWQAHKGYDCVIVSRYPLSLKRTQTYPVGYLDLAIALVDLPDERFMTDLYLMNNHFKCCDGADNEAKRQRQADGLVNWMRDARTPGGYIDLPDGTAMAVVGDLNIVSSGQPLLTLLTGNIIDNTTYGPDSPPDWDGSELADAHPLHNFAGPDDYTWRDDGGSYDPGRLDFVLYTDSVFSVSQQFVLNTVAMSDADLLATGLQRYDIALDEIGSRYDHLPVVVDFASSITDCNGNSTDDADDISSGTSQDCNDNGVPDECDIDGGTSEDANGNGVPDECEHAPGDMDCNGALNGFDIDGFLLVLGGTPPEYPEYYTAHPDCDHMLADANGDGQVNGFDIEDFIALLGG